MTNSGTDSQVNQVDKKSEATDTNSKTPKKPVEKRQNVKRNEQESLIYCGPNLPNNMLQRYAVFIDGIPEYLKDEVTKCEEIKMLLVPVEKFAGIEQKIGQNGTVENARFKAVLKYLKEQAV
ncbi:hypothetical protein BTO30_14885 [Domibacillus antri]|uniref:Uncharacterized protein n=1 Tax=Domibacillus antri TaxID=1714264 RepID=A0A1Q8Q230_9BACI|nr:hypothetical protein [Domibacillus antri]OLN21403.1 hypothetical protein BTO30_14885 [Domibacillus antri]